MKQSKASTHKKPGGIKIRVVDFVLYSASNMDRSRKFYRDVLGLNKCADYGDFWSEYFTKPTALALCNLKDKPQWRKWQGTPAVALAVDDVYATIEYLRGKGVKILAEPIETRVCHIAFIADPDGNRICIHQRKDGSAG